MLSSTKSVAIYGLHAKSFLIGSTQDINLTTLICLNFDAA